MSVKLKAISLVTADYFPEEERSKQNSLFSLIRILRQLFASEDAGQLGLYGALGKLIAMNDMYSDSVNVIYLIVFYDNATVVRYDSIHSHRLSNITPVGYDLTFQFEPIQQKKSRSSTQRDVVLFLPDEIFIIDQSKRTSWKIRYDFDFELERGKIISTKGLQRTAALSEYKPFSGDHIEER
jgi:anthranilate synthase